ncbi:MAG TPA: hypothetical protein VGS22_03290 [Thermoanaerobaculia bacterium]|nr:hypothetical protein [Thermoanaerobaculia bacterium]
MSTLPPSPPPFPLNDDALLAAFETATISAKDFHHREHVRVFWKLITTVGPESARERFVAALIRLANAQGASQLYHETLTRAWVELIAAGTSRSPSARSSFEFLESCPELLDRSILNRHYSPELLASDAARKGWIPPDRLPISEAVAEHSHLLVGV